MVKTIVGFQVMHHLKASDERGEFIAITRYRLEREAKGLAMDKAASWANDHARDFGYGAASVYRATLKLTGRPLRRR